MSGKTSSEQRFTLSFVIGSSAGSLLYVAGVAAYYGLSGNRPHVPAIVAGLVASIIAPALLESFGLNDAITKALCRVLFRSKRKG